VIVAPVAGREAAVGAVDSSGAARPQAGTNALIPRHFGRAAHFMLVDDNV
jgi:hypothetical protein